VTSNDITPIPHFTENGVGDWVIVGDIIIIIIIIISGFGGSWVIASLRRNNLRHSPTSKVRASVKLE
jgi:hypothetical protein